jgi:hypothetical protein
VNSAAGVIRLRKYNEVSQAAPIWASYLSQQSRYIAPDDADERERVVD